MKKEDLSIGLCLLGMYFIVMATLNLVGNKALGNPINGWFLLEFLAFGVVGAAALVAGIILLFRSSLASEFLQPGATGIRTTDRRQALVVRDRVPCGPRAARIGIHSGYSD